MKIITKNTLNINLIIHSSVPCMWFSIPLQMNYQLLQQTCDMLCNMIQHPPEKHHILTFTLERNDRWDFAVIHVVFIIKSVTHLFLKLLKTKTNTVKLTDLTHSGPSKAGAQLILVIWNDKSHLRKRRTLVAKKNLSMNFSEFYIFCTLECY